MKRPIVAIDIDDVIAASKQAIRAWANKVSGTSLSEEQYNVRGEYWGYYERIWAEHNLQDALKHDKFEAELIADQTHVPLLAGASFAIKELQKNFKIILITSRDPAFEDATRRWISGHFNGDIELFFSKNAAKDSRSTMSKSKGELCNELGAFLLIDDNVEHCESALEHGVEAILFGDYGWQPHVPKGAVRCEDWPKVLEYLNGRT